MRVLTVRLFVFFFFLQLAPSFAVNLTTRHFVIVNEGFSDRYIAGAAESAEASLARISSALGVVPDSTVTVIFTSSRDRFRELTEGALPDWSAAVALSNRRIVLTPLEGQKNDMEKILAHEIVHVVINDAVHEKYIPRWFHEGCAELYSGEWNFRNELYMSWMVVRGKLLSFRDIQEVFSRGSLDAGLAYDQSMIAVRRLVALYGDRTLPHLLNSMHDGKEFRGAFLEATGYSPEEFEREYLSFLKDRYGLRMLVTLLPGTWTVMMALFLIVYIVKRHRAKQKIREWEHMDASFNPPHLTKAERDDVENDIVDENDEALPDIDELIDENGEPYERPSNIIRFKPRPRRFGGDGEE